MIENRKFYKLRKRGRAVTLEDSSVRHGVGGVTDFEHGASALVRTFTEANKGRPVGLRPIIAE